MLGFKEILPTLGERVSSFNFTSLKPKMPGPSYCDTFTKICFECVLSPQQQKAPKNKQTNKNQSYKTILFLIFQIFRDGQNFEAWCVY